MDLRAKLEFTEGPRTLDEVIRWFMAQKTAGFKGNARVKPAKTTGQRMVIIIEESRYDSGLTE